MNDGRKWKALPCVILYYSVFRDPVPKTLEDSIKHLSANIIHLDDREEQAFEEIRQILHNYLQHLLNELEDLGFLVAYDHGRFRIGPALTPKRGIEGYYYYGPGDKRERRNSLFTVDRDLYGISYEVEQFEALINNPNVSEQELQKFFEDHPHFLIGSNLAKPIPHPRFADMHGNLLIPDFVLKPVVAEQRHTKWEVLDLKLPSATLLSGPARHRGFSTAVAKAITQLRNYGDYFQNPDNSATVKSVLGHALRYPRLAVIIGRLPSQGQLEEFEKAQSREPYVRLVTYDEILETQRKLVG